VLSMPPLPHWYVGRTAIRKVFARVWSDVHFRVVPTAANRQPAFAMCGRSGESAECGTRMPSSLVRKSELPPLELARRRAVAAQPGVSARHDQT
jgi:hypothetical protein